MIKVSDQAKEKAIQLMTEDGFKPFEDYIRVGVKSGGCSGLEYVLKFDNEKADSDQIFEDNGIKIIIDKNPSNPNFRKIFFDHIDSFFNITLLGFIIDWATGAIMVAGDKNMFRIMPLQ